jgi:hypothetical protein
MDDTVAMQDNSNRVVDANALSMDAVSGDPAAGGGNSTIPGGDSSLLAQKLAAVGAAATSQPSTPQQQLQQQVRILPVVEGMHAVQLCSVFVLEHGSCGQLAAFNLLNQAHRQASQ